jgi:hypothetical protein
VKAAVIAIALASLTGCLPTLSSQSLPPPGRTARLDAVDGFWQTKYYRLELTEGVAFALTCDRGGPCEKLVARSDDPAIADVRPASLAKLEPNDHRGNQTAASALVIVGKKPGQTWVRLRSKDGDRDVKVTIVAPPAIGTPATVARPSSF